MNAEVNLVRRLFTAVADRNLESLLSCYSPQVEICEDDSLPYGGRYHGLDGAKRHAAAFLDTWGRFQEGLAGTMEPRFLGDGQGTVVVLFRHRAWNPRNGRLLDTPEIGLYQISNGLVSQSHMIHPDAAKLLAFLADGTSSQRR